MHVRSHGADPQIRAGQIDFEHLTREDPVTAEFLGERLPFLLEDVCDHDVRALGYEAACVTGAHSASTAGDDHRPILETIHDFFSICCSYLSGL